MLGLADVVDASERKGGVVPDRLHPGDRPTSLQECCRPGPSAQLGPLNGPGLPSERPPDRAQYIPGREETVASEAAGENNAGRPTFRGPTEGRPKGATARGETKHLYLIEDVETHRQESLCMTGPTVRAGIHTANWEGGIEESGGGPETEGGQSGGGGGGVGVTKLC